MRIAGILAIVVLCGVVADAARAADPLRAQQYGLDAIRIDAARPISTGAGATVAVVDTGVQADHPDLGGRLLAGRDFVEEDDVPQDGDGHGTHITGVTAAVTGNGVGVESVAPGTKVLPVRVLDDTGGGSVTDVVEGIDYAAARADVINLSLGGAIPLLGNDADLDAAVDRAIDRGVIVVAAAGNNGLPFCEQPSSRGRLLCVGSVGRTGARSSFSNFAGTGGVMAPGEDILSTTKDSRYEEISGTSQATPHVVGVAALLVGRGVRGQAAVERIRNTAKDAGSPGRDGEYGAGIVDAARAVEGLGAPVTPSSPAPAPSATPAPATTPTVKAKVSVSRKVSRRTLKRSGLTISCTAPAAGDCTATAKAGRRTLASGRATVTAGGSVRMKAKLTRAGVRALRRGLRLKLVITPPGATPVTRTVRVS